ncbi:hypothetical protein [Flavobacterium microcysteis]
MKNWFLFKTILLLIFTQSLYAQQDISFPEETLESRIIRIEKLGDISIAFDHKQTGTVKVPPIRQKTKPGKKHWKLLFQGLLLYLRKMAVPMLSFQNRPL